MTDRYTPSLKPLYDEARFLNEEYEKCFGEPPLPLIEVGVDMIHVEAARSRIFHHYIDKMKKVIDDAKSSLDRS